MAAHQAPPSMGFSRQELNTLIYLEESLVTQMVKNLLAMQKA